MSAVSRVGLFGGSFDPIHVAHLIIAETVLHTLNLDYIYFIPAYKHALKNQRYSDTASPAMRINMVTAAVNDYPYFRVSRIEYDRKQISYTIDTINEFETYENLPDIDLYWIIGADNLTELEYWKKPDQIIRKVKLVVIERPGIDNQIFDEYQHQILTVKAPRLEISSTRIRQLIGQGKPWKSMVCPAVYELIEKHHLYR